MKAVEDGRYHDLDIVATFVSKNVINDIAPFLDKNMLSEYVKEKYL